MGNLKLFRHYLLKGNHLIFKEFAIKRNFQTTRIAFHTHDKKSSKQIRFFRAKPYFYKIMDATSLG